MAGKYTIRSKEETLAVVKRNLAGESACSLAREIDCNDRQVRDWVKIYLVKVKLAFSQRRSLAIHYPDMSAGRN